MNRLVSALALAVAMALAMPNLAEAQGKAAKAATRDCKIKGSDGKLLKWKCGTAQPCCYNAALNKGVCGSTVIGCF